jgi:hypothetical protein
MRIIGNGIIIIIIIIIIIKCIELPFFSYYGKCTFDKWLNVNKYRFTILFLQIVHRMIRELYIGKYRKCVTLRGRGPSELSLLHFPGQAEGDYQIVSVGLVVVPANIATGASLL